MADVGIKLLTFWGKLGRNSVLITSEGSLRNVIHDDSVPHNVYGFFLVEKRRKGFLILKYLSETTIKQLVPSLR
jgi:hypothetical protein